MLQDVNLFAQILFVRNINTSLAVNMVKPRYLNRVIAIIKLLLRILSTTSLSLDLDLIWNLHMDWTKDCRISSRA